MGSYVTRYRRSADSAPSSNPPAAIRPVLAARLKVRPKVVSVCVVNRDRVNLHARSAGLILHVMVSLLKPQFLRTPQHPPLASQTRPAP